MRSPRLAVYRAVVTYRVRGEAERVETFPVREDGAQAAAGLAVAYVLAVLRLRDFELRIVGG